MENAEVVVRQWKNCIGEAKGSSHNPPMLVVLKEQRKDLTPYMIPPTHDMIEGARKMHAWFSRHERGLTPIPIN